MAEKNDSTNSSTTANAGGFKRGGRTMIIEGQVDRSNMDVDKATGEVKGTLNVAFWSDEQYIRLAEPMQAQKIKKGDWVVVHCTTRKFRDQIQCDAGTVTEVNGKPFAA